MSNPDFAATVDAVEARRKFPKSFLAMGGCFVATAVTSGSLSAAPLPASRGKFSFPQGVASADPQPDAIVFWTRVVSAVGATDPVRLRLQVATGADFRELVVDTEITVREEQDFTTRVFVDGLAADTRYFYRFVAPDGTASRVGRSHTAPAPEAARDLRIAVFSCQHYSDGFFSAYRRLLLDEAENGPPFVHLWDDHELINDCWQGFVLRQSIHQRKVNANQAWFEYIPAALTQADPGRAGPRVTRRVRYSVDRWEPAKGPIPVRESVEGEPPMFGIRDA